MVNEFEEGEKEMCIICHDELIVSRRLKCKHRFHAKCIFDWFKNQRNTSCPICRDPVAIQNYFQDDRGSLLYRILSIFSNLGNVSFRFAFIPTQPPHPPQPWYLFIFIFIVIYYYMHLHQLTDKDKDQLLNKIKQERILMKTHNQHNHNDH